jgi:phage terminase large subunit
LQALEGYHAEYDESKKKMGNAPYHDWTSHGADAFRTFAVGYAPKKTFDKNKVYSLIDRGR